jgi:branched-chain amino acid transport system ATP-binding protein
MLQVSALEAFYDRSQVLFGLDFCAAPGEILAVLGRNGSGRSTLAKALMGLVQARGTVNWRGQPIHTLQPFERAHAGLGYVAESRDVFPTLSVQQNLLLGQKKRSAPGRWPLETLYRMFPQLMARQHTPAGVLSGGEQQMLALCRTLAGDPDLLLVDEPTEGLAPMLVEQVAVCLHRLRSQGCTVILMEQKLTLALDLADRCLVLGHGQLVFEGTPAALQTDAGVRREWLEV